MNFTDRLRQSQENHNSLICVGLDPDPLKLPRHLQGNDDGVAQFCRGIIGATKDVACAFKLNLAFFESLGDRGTAVLREVLAAVPKDIITIADGKRGDIGNSSAMYARSIMTDLRFDSATVHPYMGFDSVEPFAKDPSQGVFVLALTSNPGAKDLQYLKIGGKPLYEHVVRKVKSWNTAGNFGLVVGATRPVQLKQIRTLAPKMPLLIPGIGAQGGDLRKAVKDGCDATGALAVINVGRSILFASSGEDYADAARTAALALREEIGRYREQYFG